MLKIHHVSPPFPHCLHFSCLALNIRFWQLEFCIKSVLSHNLYMQIKTLLCEWLYKCVYVISVDRLDDVELVSVSTCCWSLPGAVRWLAIHSYTSCYMGLRWPNRVRFIEIIIIELCYCGGAMASWLVLSCSVGGTCKLIKHLKVSRINIFSCTVE